MKIYKIPLLNYSFVYFFRTENNFFKYVFKNQYHFP